jgi:undecaprenyl-diphosphatase
MSIVESILLGAVQGITEFLPISSSGHLIIFQEIFNLPKSFTYDVLLNIGTLLALVVFFRKRLSLILINTFKLKKYKYLSYVIMASIPTLLVGFIGSDLFEKLGSFTWLIVLMLTSLGVAMIVWGNRRGDRQITKKDTIIVGLAQVLALIPGTSRSGVTILAALIRGVNIKAATEFSFMLAIPTISAAILHTLFFNDGINFIKTNSVAFTVGNLTSFAFGAVAIRTLLNILNKKGLTPFGWYRIALGCLIPVLLLFKLV